MKWWKSYVIQWISVSIILAMIKSEVHLGALETVIIAGVVIFLFGAAEKGLKKNDTTKSIRNESIQNQVSTIECTSLNNDEAKSYGDDKKKKETQGNECLKNQNNTESTANMTQSKNFVSLKAAKELLASFAVCLGCTGVIIYSQWAKNETQKNQIADLDTKLTKTKKDLHEYQNKYSTIVAENSELNAIETEGSSILTQFDDSRRTDGTMSVTRNIVVLSEYESTNIDISLNEYGSWTVYFEQIGDSASGEWGDNSNPGTVSFKISSNSKGYTLFRFTNTINSNYVETLVIVK